MKRIIYFFVFIATLSSCKDENQIDQEFLSGKWFVEQAYRNDKLTNTLEGAFFYFDGQIMTTNFQGAEQQATYVIHKNQIQLTKGMDYTFYIKKLGSKQLELKFEIHKTQFVFKVKKE
ncbi:MAG: membrane lipoprotein lipid attachment site-containing protein [Saprospiraceae bacterium]|nr:membrane lipoprotein lipid attachment site-containing protein [Saprospiraceae bacterium]